MAEEAEVTLRLTALIITLTKKTKEKKIIRERNPFRLSLRLKFVIKKKKKDEEVYKIVVNMSP